ncbi:hypothetical protein SAMN04515618_105216 [Collimonas sp. OK307]|nr:hypothetical protein SAMN04515618_105216 [Collimonas sp. OK307]
MWRASVGWKDQLAALKHVFPQFPTDTHHIWQRPNADFKFKFKSNCNCNCNVKIPFFALCFRRYRSIKDIADKLFSTRTVY